MRTAQIRLKTSIERVLPHWDICGNDMKFKHPRQFCVLSCIFKVHISAMDGYGIFQLIFFASIYFGLYMALL